MCSHFSNDVALLYILLSLYIWDISNGGPLLEIEVSMCRGQELTTHYKREGYGTNLTHDDRKGFGTNLTNDVRNA